MSKFAMVPRKVAEFHEVFNDIARDLMKSIRKKRDPNSNILNDVPDLFFNWSFECKLTGPIAHALCDWLPLQLSSPLEQMLLLCAIIVCD